MINVPAATPAETGANKGKVQSFDWATGIAPDQNVTGLPVNDKGVVTLNIPGDSFEVSQFETVAEVQSAAGEHYESWVLSTANRDLRRAQVVARATAAKKLTVAPANILEWVRSFTYDVAALFAPATTERATRKTGVTAQIAAIAPNVDSMSADELRAFITQMAAKLAK